MKLKSSELISQKKKMHKLEKLSAFGCDCNTTVVDQSNLKNL